MTPAQADARTLLSACRHGVLSSRCRQAPGYPLGCVTPYVLDASGAPIILVSALTQQLSRLRGEGACRFSMVDDAAPLGRQPRLCLLAQAQALRGRGLDAACARYLRFFPQCKEHVINDDFAFWRLQPLQLRYRDGGGRNHRFKPALMPLRTPLAARFESSLCLRMNAAQAGSIGNS